MIARLQEEAPLSIPPFAVRYGASRRFIQLMPGLSGLPAEPSDVFRRVEEGHVLLENKEDWMAI